MLLVLAALVPVLVGASIVQHRRELSKEDKSLSFEGKIVRARDAEPLAVTTSQVA